MLNQTNTINLEDHSPLNIFNFADAFAEKPSKKLPTPCQFIKENNLKSFRSKTLKNGNIRLSVVSKSGHNFYAIQRNFVLAYIKLVRNFQSSII